MQVGSKGWVPDDDPGRAQILCSLPQCIVYSESETKAGTWVFMARLSVAPADDHELAPGLHDTLQLLFPADGVVPSVSLQDKAADLFWEPKLQYCTWEAMSVVMVIWFLEWVSHYFSYLFICVTVYTCVCVRVYAMVCRLNSEDNFSFSTMWALGTELWSPGLAARHPYLLNCLRLFHRVTAWQGGGKSSCLFAEGTISWLVSLDSLLL